jgi:hypothetical protein
VSEPPGFTWAEVLAAVTLAMLAITVIVWRVRAQYKEQPDMTGRPATLATALDETLESVRRESEPRRAVIAAYAMMERLVAAHGLPRRTFEAPLEYLVRVFQNLNADRRALGALTELFELAKFSHHEISQAMKEQAVAALITIRDGVREQA